jgi:Domain of unknown function (DUF4349)
MSATDPTELDGYEELVSQLRATAPVAPEQLRQRVLDLEPASRRRRISSKRRLVLVVVPVAAALAVGAAIIHGFVSSGSRNANRAHAAALALAPSLGAPPHRIVTNTNTAAFGALHTQSKGSALDQAPVPGASESVVIPKNRLVHADATLQVQVPSHSALSKATNKATQIVAALGGYAQSVQYQTSRQGYGSAFLALRVPVDKAQTAIAQLGALGTLVSQQISTRDLQQQLTRQTNQIGVLQRAIAVYEQALQSGSLSPSQRVEIQIRLANAQHSLKQLRKAKSGTLASGATADISLTLVTHKSAVVVGHHKSGRFDRLLGSAAGFLALEGIIVLYALVVLSPVLVLGGLGWWLVRERRRREESRLLASA